jgi:hypothetical protein
MKFLKQPAIQNMLDDKVRENSHSLPGLQKSANPYYSVKPLTSATAQRDDIVFITSRFRSGSTLLWNLFRQTGMCTSLYEPFNERQWFNPKLRGNHVDDSHRGVDDYWTEYDGMQELGDLYDESWINKNLLMTEESWDPAMKAFIEKTIELSPKRPVLQFNRIDLRLPWLKHHFPNAKIVHLYRHPRDQWCSFLTDSELMNKDDVVHTYKDAFYLNTWCKDLAQYYPVLDERVTVHPYQRFYYLWRLSYLHGITFSDHSLSFENITESPKQEIQSLLDVLNITNVNIDKLCDLIQAPKPQRWRSYASEDWFQKHEAICEHNLSLMLDKKNRQHT